MTFALLVASSRPSLRGASRMVRILSLGAGVQSTTLALMAAHGEIGPMPDCAIFADTQDEGMATYQHLERLRSILPFPVSKIGRASWRGRGGQYVYIRGG